MKVVIQRVTHASVVVDDSIVGKIERGLLLFVGFGQEDTEQDIDWCIKKILGMRIFNDEAGLMNLSVQDVGGGILSVSQFTLLASTKKGNRPSFILAAKPDAAKEMYHLFNEKLSALHPKVETGIFGVNMQVDLLNDGPVTIVLDSQQKV